MPSAWMPGAVHKPIPYRSAAGRFTHTPLGWILHVVVGNGSPYKGFANAPKDGRKFSTFWVSKTGVIEQYAETYYKSWAQRDGNGDYWSVETEGFPEEPLTAAQIKSLAKIHNFLGAADAIASRPGQKGIGTHYMGGAAWGGHSCPDPVGHEGKGPRSHQRAAILTASHSAPPPPPKKKVHKMQWLAKTAGPGMTAIFLCDGQTRKHLVDERQLLSIKERLGHFGLSAAISEYAPGELASGIAGVLVGPDGPEGTY